MFETVAEIEAFADWMNAKGGLDSLRLMRARDREVLTRKAAAGVAPEGQSPDRKRARTTRGSQRALSGRGGFFLANYVLRTGSNLSTAAGKFGVAPSTASTHILAHVWHWHFFLAARFPAAAYTKERVQNRMPPSYVKHFGKRIRRLLDAHPIYTQMPSSRRLRRCMYNKYYGKHAVKLLVGCTPFGPADFGPDACPARIGDEQISEVSGACSDIPPGMDLCADKGFYLAKQLFRAGAFLIQPMEKPRNKRYSRRALLYSRRVSRKRIHIERWVRRATARCRWLQRRVPINQLHLVYPITQICMRMGNFRCPIR